MSRPLCAISAHSTGAVLMPPPPFWRKLWLRIEPDAESWLVEIFYYCRIFSLLLLAFLIFRFLRIVGLESAFVDGMEKMDHAATGLVFCMFLLAIIRNAFVSFFFRK
jgi:hypothetical protein